MEEKQGEKNILHNGILSVQEALKVVKRPNVVCVALVPVPGYGYANFFISKKEFVRTIEFYGPAIDSISLYYDADLGAIYVG